MGMEAETKGKELNKDMETQNIRKFAEMWGDVVFIDKETSKKSSFASAKVVIDTLGTSPIEDEALLQIEDKGLRVSVFESKTVFTIIHTGPLNKEASSSSFGAPTLSRMVGANMEAEKVRDSCQQTKATQETRSCSQEAAKTNSPKTQLPREHNINCIEGRRAELLETPLDNGQLSNSSSTTITKEFQAP
ncbi:hypothetical protein Cgig2_031912 [Carnegiea gigantea]|uniref:Uncharacterized protein n=1 Tax=Carnegiea gigantea TaxID=171969 RepID=A0A9Q1KSR2_9CARY|nr:hypothetical protein Cgig2_031912 [Carnegiea gigantea]